MFELEVGNMTCGSCVGSVTRAVKALDPGATVAVDLSAGKVRIEGRHQQDSYARVITEAGFPVRQRTEQAPAKARGGCCCG